MKISKKRYIHPIIYISSIILISSCAGPENYRQKMTRYEAKPYLNNQVPEIKINHFQFKTNKLTETSKKVNRLPASANGVERQSSELPSANLSNKKLYFLTLLHEYMNLANYSPEFVKPSISICPNFHTELLNYNEKFSANSQPSSLSKKFAYDSQKYSDDMYLASTPELLLPLSKEETVPKVVDILKNSNQTITTAAINNLVHQALEIHLEKTYTEIRELCDYGVSNNYFIYENLITHIKNNKFEAGDENMNILLKTTIFSNIALLTSLDKNSETKSATRSIASVPDFKSKKNYSSDLITRLNISWANQYFDFIKESK